MPAVSHFLIAIVLALPYSHRAVHLIVLLCTSLVIVPMHVNLPMLVQHLQLIKLVANYKLPKRSYLYLCHQICCQNNQ